MNPEKFIDTYLSYYKMSREEFDSVLDKWVNRKLFYKSQEKNIWIPKFELK